MKILASGLNGKDINYCCEHCGCVLSLESKEDFYIAWVDKPYGTHFWEVYKDTQIPVYNIMCPECGNIVNIGGDPMDLDENLRNQLCLNNIAEIIFNREDWKERYKTDVRRK
jgi:hypothetical protein